MRVAIIGGTGIYQMPGLDSESQLVQTRYGEVLVFVGKGKAEDLVFLPRHGSNHAIPPHRINYRANLKALEQLGVKRVLAIFAVGSLWQDVPPHSLIALDQILDFTHDRASTFYDGGTSGVGQADMTEPFCPALREELLAQAFTHGLTLRPRGTYVCRAVECQAPKRRRKFSKRTEKYESGKRSRNKSQYLYCHPLLLV